MALSPELAASNPELGNTTAAGTNVQGFNNVPDAGWLTMRANASEWRVNATEVTRDFPIITLAPSLAPLAAAAPNQAGAPGNAAARTVLPAPAAAPSQADSIEFTMEGSPSSNASDFVAPQSAGATRLLDSGKVSNLVASMVSPNVQLGPHSYGPLEPFPVLPGTEYKPLPNGWKVFSDAGPSYQDVDQGTLANAWFEASLIATTRTFRQVPLAPTARPDIYTAIFYGLYKTQGGLPRIAVDYMSTSTQMLQRDGRWVVDDADTTLGSGRKVAWPAMMAKAFSLYMDIHPGGHYERSGWYRDSRPGWGVMDQDWSPSDALFALTGLPPVTLRLPYESAVSIYNVANGPRAAAVVSFQSEPAVMAMRGYDSASRQISRDGVYALLSSPVGLPGRATVWGEGFGKRAVSLVLGNSYTLLGQDTAGRMRLHNPFRHNIVWDDIGVGWYDSQNPEVIVPLAAMRLLGNNLHYVSEVLPPATAPNIDSFDPLNNEDLSGADDDICGVKTAGGNKCFDPDFESIPWGSTSRYRGAPSDMSANRDGSVFGFSGSYPRGRHLLGLGGDNQTASISNFADPIDIPLAKVLKSTAYYDEPPTSWSLSGGNGEIMASKQIVQGDHGNCWMLAAMIATIDSGQAPSMRVKTNAIEAEFYGDQRYTIRIPRKTLLLTPQPPKYPQADWTIDGSDWADGFGYHATWPAYWTTAMISFMQVSLKAPTGWDVIDRDASPAFTLQVLTGRTPKYTPMNPAYPGSSLKAFIDVCNVGTRAKTVCTTGDGDASMRPRKFNIPGTNKLITTNSKTVGDATWWLSAVYGGSGLGICGRATARTLLWGCRSQ